MQRRNQRVVEGEEADPPQQATAQRDGQPQGNAAGNNGEAEIEAPEGGIDGGRLYKLLGEERVASRIRVLVL